MPETGGQLESRHPQRSQAGRLHGNERETAKAGQVDEQDAGFGPVVTAAERAEGDLRGEDGDEADRGDDAVVTVAAPQGLSGADQQQEHEDLQVGHWVGAGPPRRGPAIPSSGDDAQRRGGGLRAFRVAEADGAQPRDRVGCSK